MVNPWPGQLPVSPPDQNSVAGPAKILDFVLRTFYSRTPPSGDRRLALLLLPPGAPCDSGRPGQCRR
eukprot:6242093-Lingulodinium_polyedra.AAC.1